MDTTDLTGCTCRFPYCLISKSLFCSLTFYSEVQTQFSKNKTEQIFKFSINCFCLNLSPGQAVAKKARCADLTISHAKAAPLAAFLPRDDDTWIKKTLTLSRFNAANFVSSKIHIQLVSMETYTCNQMMTLLIAALSKMININSSYCRLDNFSVIFHSSF